MSKAPAEQDSLLHMLLTIDDSYLAFYRSLCLYVQEPRPAMRFEYGLEAARLAARSGQYEFSRRVFQEVTRGMSARPEWKARMAQTLADIYLLQGYGEEASHYLAQLPDSVRSSASGRVRISHALVLLNRPLEALDELRLLATTDPHPNPRVTAIENGLAHVKDGPRRSPPVAAALSMLLPGAGQMYARHWYDGLNAFAFCGLLGGAAYTGWKYQGDHRDFLTLPIITTGAFALLYVSNIWGAAASALRFNRYQEAVRYQGILEEYRALQRGEGNGEDMGPEDATRQGP